MRIWKCFGIACLFVMSVVSTFPAMAANQLWEEYDKLINKRQAVGTLGPDLFGDQLSFYTGSLSFSQSDISLPGNSSLPVEVTRMLSIEAHRGGGFPHHDSPMGDWDLDLPNISGTFATTQGWVGANGAPATRCSQPAAPAGHVFGASNTMEASEYWHGYQMRLPGGGGGELLGARSSGGEILASPTGRTRPGAGGPYYWLTSDWTYVSCLSTLANASTQGEGFLAITADGTRYWFNWMATFHEDRLKEKRKSPAAGDDILDRQRLALYATRVEDRFGNSVTYTYTNASNAPVRLGRIDASDGRSIVLEYNAYGQVTKATAGVQQWSYEYSGVGTVVPVLTAVVQPDSRRWELNVAGLSGRLQYEHPVHSEPLRSCTDPGAVIDASYTGTITHPSGAVGEFTVRTTRFGRSNVLLMCKNVTIGVTSTNDTNDDVAHYPVNWDSLALTQKRIYGPGLVTAEWNYGYGATISWFLTGGGTEDLPVCTSGDCIQPQCVSDACAGTSVTSVLGPGSSFQRYTFGNSYRYNEGKLLKVESGSGPDNILSTRLHTYELASSGQAFPTPIGISPQLRGEGGFVAEYLRPQRSTVTVQQGVTFSSVVNGGFDRFARALSVSKGSSQWPGKTDVTVYYNDLHKWVLGQVEKTTTNGIEVSRTEYDNNALPWKIYSFGKLQNTIRYNVAAGAEGGTIRSISDARNNKTMLSNWKRGIPQTIAHPDGTSESAVVNDSGWTVSVTDENGAAYTTNYTYDLMGRLASITYPTGDSTVWAVTTLSFQRVDAEEHGIPAGHWKQTVRTGNARKAIYFDAMWRPLVEETYDAADSIATLSQTVKRYDADGRVVYQSYPMRGLTAYTAPSEGVHTTYDALDRVTHVEQNSELGPLTTTTEYLDGFQTRTTNPRRQSTTISYMTYDQPGTDWPAAISQPEGAYTHIVRNLFGMPTSLTRRNADGSAVSSRLYVYDERQQLCKMIEPETAATVMGYDAAGNLAWSASGQNLLSTTACDSKKVPMAVKVTRTYDARNRLSTLLFPDGNGTQSWGYTPDGLPSEITTLNDQGTTSAVNAYTYNKRRLLTGESLRQKVPDLYTWALGYGYNANGNVVSHTSPGLTVDYAPNALGQPTQAGSYATGVSYFANGAMAQFTYGNGIVHTLAQNGRGLPDRSRDAYDGTAVHDDSYDFDANGNVSAISDGLPGNRGNRDMTYDGLDRLTSANSAMFGPASYSYDALDNPKTVKVAGRDHTYVYDPSWHLTNVTNTVGGMSVVGLGYDPQGNLANNNGQIYRFDYGNRLREATGKEQYRYDGHGRRIQASHSTLGNIYSMYGSDGVLRYQQDYRSTKTSSYVYLNGSLVARVTDVTPMAPAPRLIAPANSGDGSYTVTWSTIPNTSSYRLEESVNGGAWTQVADTDGLTWSASGKANGSYRYRGRSCRLGCSTYSEIVTVSVNLMPTGVPVLSGPSYNTNGSYTLNWSSVSLATRYELDEQANEGVWTPVQDTAALSNDVVGNSNGTYGYRVRACNTAGCAAWSATATVSVQLPPASPPTLGVPAQGLSGAYTVTWGTSAGATDYVLEESANDGPWLPAYTGTAQSQAFDGKAEGSNAYRIKACNLAGCSGMSASSNVQVIYAPTSAPIASVAAPGANGDYTVSWTAVPTATSYQLEESVNDGIWSLTHNVVATSAAFADKAGGNYSYRAKACNAAGCGPGSAAVGTQVFDAPTTPPIASVPAQSFDGAHTVSWTVVGGATRYELEESVDGGAWTLLYAAAGTSTALSEKAAGNYSYRVRACNIAGCGPISAPVDIVVTHAPEATPTANVSPQSFDGAYTVGWTTVANATSYQLEENVNGGAWTLQSNAADTSSTVSGKLAGTYGYRIRGCNVAGCGPTSGIVATRVVLVPTDAPRVTSPANVTTTEYTVSWNGVAAATSYQLMERVNGGGFMLIVDAAVNSAAISGKVNATYEYLARGCNVAGCGPWSDTVATVVYVPPPIPDIPERLYGEREALEGGSPTFTFYVYWTASQGATHYELQDDTGAIVDYGSDQAYQGTGIGHRTYQVRACNVSGCSGWQGPLSL